jgi:putative colanic acid biosynthesis acetyltransferase WcaF
LGDVRIGDSVCLSQDVYLCTGNHNYRTPDFHLIVRPITIESNVWVAARAVLAPGTQLADGVVVGLASVVKGAVPANAIMSGNPAAIVGYR